MSARIHRSTRFLHTHNIPVRLLSAFFFLPSAAKSIGLLRIPLLENRSSAYDVALPSFALAAPFPVLLSLLPLLVVFVPAPAIPAIAGAPLPPRAPDPP